MKQQFYYISKSNFIIVTRLFQDPLELPYDVKQNKNTTNFIYANVTNNPNFKTQNLANALNYLIIPQIKHRGINLKRSLRITPIYSLVEVIEKIRDGQFKDNYELNIMQKVLKKLDNDQAIKWLSPAKIYNPIKVDDNQLNILTFKYLTGLNTNNQPAYTPADLAKHFNVSEGIIREFTKFLGLTKEDVTVNTKQSHLMLTENFKNKLAKRLIITAPTKN